MPLVSKTWSSSRRSSRASAYWKPEQPPPRTPTRRPTSPSAVWPVMKSRTFSAAMSVSWTMDDHCIGGCVGIVNFNAQRRGAEIAYRVGTARLARKRGGPHRWRRPLPRRGGVRPLRRSQPNPAAQARLRRLRRRDRRTHPRALDQDFNPYGRTNMTNTEIREFIDNAIKENPVMLFMKGTPHQPACGFSARTSACLNALGVKYAALDILPDPRIREELSGLSGWPTIPQLFVGGELVGGCDIVTEMYETGELAEKLGVEQPEDEPEVDAPQLQRAPLGLENRLD